MDNVLSLAIVLPLIHYSSHRLLIICRIGFAYTLHIPLHVQYPTLSSTKIQVQKDQVTNIGVLFGLQTTLNKCAVFSSSDNTIMVAEDNRSLATSSVFA